jgi:SAM-dependent methyltransferase
MTNFWDNLMGTDEHAANYMATYGEGPGFETRHTVGSFINDGESVLDVGCGPGWNYDHFQKYGPKVFYAGEDYSERFVRVANFRNPDVYQVGDCRQLNHRDESVDVVILQDCLEHTNGYAYPKASCSLCMRSNNDSIEAWNVSKKAVQNLESQSRISLGQFTKEVDATNTIERKLANREEKQIDISTKMDISKSSSTEEEKESTESLWSKNSEGHSKDGKVSTILTDSEETTDQKTSNFGSEVLDTDKELQISSVPTAESLICTKHGPIHEALRVARKRVIISFWHLDGNEGTEHINDDSNDGWGAWYDKDKWEEFLNTLPFVWHHLDVAPKSSTHIWHFYIIEKEDDE